MGVRLLLMSDIHANGPAMRAVLEHALSGGQRYDRVYHLGDAVGYGPHPREVVQKLRTMEAQCVMGNHDQMLLGLLGGQPRSTPAT
ncbi:metallophosphoesterase family protein [Deinococcus lacus]|uniref:Metallophosphoesterase family protein n=1 Tax=Deinococcus lacus TaxID=392561 RepID=A0ABW1YC33_9DEIO